MRIAAGDPLDVTGFKLHRAGAAAFDVAAHVEIGDGNDQMWAVVMVGWDGAPGRKFEFRDAGVVFDEEDFLSARIEDVEAAVLVPVCRRGGVGLFVLHELDGDVAEGRVGPVARYVGEVARGEAGLAIFESGVNGRLAFDFVGDLRITESDEKVVVTMAVHEGGFVRAHFDLKDADVLVFEGEMVVGFVGDLHFGGGLDEGEDSDDQKESGSFHGAGF